MKRLLSLCLALACAAPVFSAETRAPASKKAVPAKKAPAKKAAKKGKAAKAEPGADPSASLGASCFSTGADGKLRMKNPGSGIPEAVVEPRFVARYEKGPYQYIFDHPDPHVGRLGCKDGVWSRVTEEQEASCGAPAADNGLQKKGADCDKGGYVPTGLKVP